MRDLKRLLSLAVLFTCLVCPAANAVDEVDEDQGVYFTINRFHSDINIHEDGDIFVAETIEVIFHHKRHGIYREIPFKYENDLGDVIRMPVEVLSVTDRDGQERRNRVRYEGNVVNIRIGHPDKYVIGKQTYVISYRVENGIRFFEDHDELYWNVTGNYWDEPIWSASATVNLISSQKSAQTLTGCYTGRYGRRQSDCTVETLENGARFETTRRMFDREGLTIAFGFDKGIVAEPSEMDKFITSLNLMENWVFIVPIFVLIFMVVQWSRKGRDPRVREAVTVMYEPPKFSGKHISAAEVGALVDERFDSRDLTGAIVGLAVKGCLKIEEVEVKGIISMLDSVDYKLVNIKQPDDDVTRFERQLYWHLFPSGTESIMVSDLKNKFYKNLKSLRDTLWTDLRGKKYFNVSPPTVRASYVGIGVVIAVFGTLAAVWFAHGYTFKGVAAAIVSGFIVIVFSNAMPVKTRLGSRAHDHVLGFQEFMNRADRDRLERMGKEVFYKYMPYAIALDVVDHWSRAFEGLLDEPPNWYVSQTGFRAFSPVMFSQSLGSATTSLSSATFSAPRGSGVSGGSGGGGGGFSGGGGGGGGGGSW